MSYRFLGRSARQAGASFVRPLQFSQRRCYAQHAKDPAPTNLRSSLSFALYGLVFTTAGAVTTWYALRSQGMGFYTDEESLSLFTPAETEAEALRVEAYINAHPLVAELRKRTDLTESRPHMKMPGQYRARSLTGGALMGQGRLTVPPFAWNDAAGTEMVSVAHVGEDICGHPGIVHGGLLATMLDEGLARCCLPALPHRIAVTANLNINYRKPVPAGSFLVLRARTVKLEGRKAWLEGHIELLTKPGETPQVLTEATALFISPKYAAMMPKIV